MVIKKTLLRLWNSPTLMTWLSYLTKSANLLLVLPLILHKFKAPEIAIWYLFATILSMSGLADLGFRNTFVRLFAHAFGGAKGVGIINSTSHEGNDGQPNWVLIEDLYAMMRKMYVYLSLILIILLLSLGSWALAKPISLTADTINVWSAWFVIAIGIVCDFYGKVFSNYLEGLFQVALVRRIETIFKLGSIFTSFCVLLYAPSLLNLAIANSSWLLANYFRDRFLARMVFERRLREFKPKAFDKGFFLKIWQPAWRSGISGLMSQGLTNLTGIIYAQIGNSAAVASYMIALRVITEIRNVSNAPFYSKIPLLARLRSEGAYPKFIQVAQRSMRLTHIVFALGVVVVGLFFNTFIKFTGSHINLIDPQLWLLLSIAFYVHRYGAMHMQLYLTTNHVIAHIADSVAGTLFIVTAYLLIKPLNVFAVPIGMLVGYLGFYSWFAARYSYGSLNISFWSFEKSVSFIPFLTIVVFIVLRCIM